jgi:hypothetical protein
MLSMQVDGREIQRVGEIERLVRTLPNPLQPKARQLTGDPSPTEVRRDDHTQEIPALWHGVGIEGDQRVSNMTGPSKADHSASNFRDQRQVPAFSIGPELLLGALEAILHSSSASLGTDGRHRTEVVHCCRPHDKPRRKPYPHFAAQFGSIRGKHDSMIRG